METLVGILSKIKKSACQRLGRLDRRTIYLLFEKENERRIEYYMRSLKSICNLNVALFTLFFLSSLTIVNGQSTLFNIPSTDIVPEKKVYLEFDFLAHFEGYNNGGFQSYVPRAVVGLGKKVEIGVNVAYTKSAVPNSIEIQPNIKYQAYQNEKYGVAVSTGVILYAPITRRAGTNTFGLVYSNVSKQFKGTYGPRITGGGYGLINRASGTGNKAGVLIGLEQPVSTKVKFVTDWFSGKNRFGYATPGLAITTGKTSAFYAGYSIGNSGRKNNALFVYWGITF